MAGECGGGREWTLRLCGEGLSVANVAVPVTGPHPFGLRPQRPPRKRGGLNGEEQMGLTNRACFRLIVLAPSHSSAARCCPTQLLGFSWLPRPTPRLVVVARIRYLGWSLLPQSGSE